MLTRAFGNWLTSSIRCIIHGCGNMLFDEQHCHSYGGNGRMSKFFIVVIVKFYITHRKYSLLEQDCWVKS